LTIVGVLSFDKRSIDNAVSSLDNSLVALMGCFSC